MSWDDVLMQGRSRLDRELLDAEMIAGHLVPPGSVFAFLAEHRRELFPDAFTADLFTSGTGRPSLPADLVGAVLVLKELHDLSDTQTADALKFDIRWKVACGRSLTQMSFDPSALVYWRRRIAKSKRPDRAFDAGSELVTDELAGVVELAGEGSLEGDAAAGDALGVLALVAGQDVETAQDSAGPDGRWRCARKVAPDRVISTVDREARHTRKSKSKRRDGFRGHVAAEPDTRLITDCEMTMAAGEGSTDAGNGVKMASRDPYRRLSAGPAARPPPRPAAA